MQLKEKVKTDTLLPLWQTRYNYNSQHLLSTSFLPDTLPSVLCESTYLILLQAHKLGTISTCIFTAKKTNLYKVE